MLRALRVLRDETVLCLCENLVTLSLSLYPLETAKSKKTAPLVVRGAADN